MNKMSLEFFLRVILPELIGRWFSRRTPTSQRTMGPENPAAHAAGEESSSDRPPVSICYCRGGLIVWKCLSVEVWKCGSVEVCKCVSVEVW